MRDQRKFMRGRRRGKPFVKAELTEEEKLRLADQKKASIEAWKPRTDLGRRVKSGEITTIDQVLDSGQRIMEQEIVDALLGDVSSDLIMIGQSKGKFGGGQRRALKQ